MVREMVGGCCVCLDERGWNENPLVYCDGTGCSVAVHQACYGIVKVPSGPWFCCKCRSQERVARVKCELCPMKEGALKRTDSGGWAHVVCALYIPEVRFGNVSTMEPIVFSSVPHERFLKTCYICEASGRESRTANGACMNCHKSGCKLSFHVTCAQSKRQLCEEASVNGHVQYVGYCSIHWQKRFKQPSVSQPPVSENEIKKNGKDKKRSRNDSTSSTNSIENSKTKRKSKLNELDIKSASDDDIVIDSLSPVTADEAKPNTHTSTSSDTAIVPTGQQLNITENTHSLTVNGADKSKLNSPLNTPVVIQQYKEEHIDVVSSPLDDDSQTEQTELDQPKPINKESKKRKAIDKDKTKKKVKVKEKTKDNDISKKKKDKHTSEKKVKNSDRKRKYPQPSQVGLLENGKVSSWESITPKTKETPDNFQEFLEHQWSESAQFLLSKAEHFDVASLLNCLHQLKSDNTNLEKKLLHLQSRRDRLLGVNARLASSITSPPPNHPTEQKPAPLSAMLSKLNADISSSGTEATSQQPKRSRKTKKLKEDKNNNQTVNSPDLALLAATSAKFECNSLQHNSSTDSATSTRLNSSIDTSIPKDEKPPVTLSPRLVEPNVHIPSAVTNSKINGGGSMFGSEMFGSYQHHIEHKGESSSKKITFGK